MNQESDRPFTKSIVGGVKVDVCTDDQLVTFIKASALEPVSNSSRCKVIFDVNGQGIALFHFDRQYRSDLNEADAIHADGLSVVLASRLFCQHPIPERTATTDLIHSVAKVISGTSVSIYFLGAKGDVIRQAAANFRNMYPNATLAGYRDGYLNEDELKIVADEINGSGARIVFLGMGKPKEQRIALLLSKRLKASCIITAGGCFDFLAGEAPRAPKWVQTYGMEWLFRLIQDPRRLAWRYTWTNTVSLVMLMIATRRKPFIDTANRPYKEIKVLR